MQACMSACVLHSQHVSMCAAREAQPLPPAGDDAAAAMQVFNIFTIAVKFLSCALAVAAGLPVGPEGPLIHIGAALGAAISQTHSTTLGWAAALARSEALCTNVVVHCCNSRLQHSVARLHASEAEPDLCVSMSSAGANAVTRTACLNACMSACGTSPHPSLPHLTPPCLPSCPQLQHQHVQTLP